MLAHFTGRGTVVSMTYLRSFETRVFCSRCREDISDSLSASEAATVRRSVFIRYGVRTATYVVAILLLTSMVQLATTPLALFAFSALRPNHCTGHDVTSRSVRRGLSLRLVRPASTSTANGMRIAAAKTALVLFTWWASSVFILSVVV